MEAEKYSQLRHDLYLQDNNWPTQYADRIRRGSLNDKKKTKVDKVTGGESDKEPLCITL